MSLASREWVGGSMWMLPGGGKGAHDLIFTHTLTVVKKPCLCLLLVVETGSNPTRDQSLVYPMTCRAAAVPIDQGDRSVHV